MRPKNHAPLFQPLTREQELLQEFQQSEAAAEREGLEPVDKQMRNHRRTWAEMPHEDAAE